MSTNLQKPILLDLFCRAGGCSKGYMDAGFYVIGVDIEPQPNYIGDEFFQADALGFLERLIAGAPLVPQCLFTYTDCYRLEDLAAIHASPPCQAFTCLRSLHSDGKEHPNLIPQTRDLLIAAGKPYVIENVPGSPLEVSLMLCGSMFGLQTECGAQLRRHRNFETNWFEGETPECDHENSRGVTICVAGDHPRDGSEFTIRAAQKEAATIGVHGTHPRKGNATSERKRLLTITGHSAQTNVRPRSISVVGRSPECYYDPPGSRQVVISVTGSTPQRNVVRNRVRECFSIEQARMAMGIDWMPMKNLSQAIPPKYTEWIGIRLLEHLSK